MADGEAEHTRIRESELDQVLGGYLQLRDPVGTGQRNASGARLLLRPGLGVPGGVRRRHGGLSGRLRTRAGPSPRPSSADEDLATRGDAPYPTSATLAASRCRSSGPGRSTRSSTGTFDPPTLEPFDGSPPACADDPDLDLVACPGEGVVGYDDTDLARPLYDEIGDFAVLTAVALPYALVARDQLGPLQDDDDARRSAICLTGWYAAAVADGELSGIAISPGDVDESVQFLLTRARDEAVLARPRHLRVRAGRPLPRRLPRGRLRLRRRAR